MFGASPSVFKNIYATKEAARAFEKEEEISWVVVQKNISTDVGFVECFRPCRKEDVGEAKILGWKELK